jgi:hypothetical protein
MIEEKSEKRRDARDIPIKENINPGSISDEIIFGKKYETENKEKIEKCKRKIKWKREGKNCIKRVGGTLKR